MKRLMVICVTVIVVVFLLLLFLSGYLSTRQQIQYTQVCLDHGGTVSWVDDDRLICNGGGTR